MLLAFVVSDWMVGLVSALLLIVGLLLIGLVLIQRGKGGGLSGAFGGAGGSSAFGSRAGDTFTRITIYFAAVWLLLIMGLIKMVQPSTKSETPVAAEQGPPSPPDDGQ
jgi:preprotein translocase subunit SecG